MATVIEEDSHPTHDSPSNWINALIGLIVFIILLWVFIAYGLPLLRQITNPPAVVNPPERIDVNVNPGQ